MSKSQETQQSMSNVQFFETVSAPRLTKYSRETIIDFLQEREAYERRLADHKKAVNPKTCGQALKDSVDIDLLEEIGEYKLKELEEKADTITDAELL